MMVVSALAPKALAPKVRQVKISGKVQTAVVPQIIDLAEMIGKGSDKASLVFDAENIDVLEWSDLGEETRHLPAMMPMLTRLDRIAVIADQSPRVPDIAARLYERRAAINGLNMTSSTLRQQFDRRPARITTAAMKKFGEVVRREFKDGNDKARQQNARAVIDVRVGSNIKIKGQTEALAQGMASAARSKGEVPSFARKWCGREDSNFHGLSATTTSTLRVYQFRHDRTPIQTGGPQPAVVGARH